MATLLKSRLRETDTVARLGGDEFAIVLNAVGEEQALEVARKLVTAVSDRPVAAGGQPMRITTSIGLTMIGSRPVTEDEVLVEADVAMYEARDGGRDQVALYRPDGGSEGRMRAGLSWNERIREALEDDRFTLYLQPILNLGSGEVDQYEVLLRMLGEDGQVVLPGAFLPTAERFGLIQAVDRWVVRETIRLIATSQREHEGMQLLLESTSRGSPSGTRSSPSSSRRRWRRRGSHPRA